MKNVTIPLLFLLCALDAGAQEARNAAYFELGGSGIVPTLNYERRLSGQWFGRIGLSYVESTSLDDGEVEDRDETFVIPLTASWVSHRSANHHFEAGGGLTFAVGDRQEVFDFDDGDDERLSNVAVTGLAGYRYQRPDGGFQFRAVVTPVALDGDLFFWAGVSFGYAW